MDERVEPIQQNSQQSTLGTSGVKSPKMQGIVKYFIVIFVIVIYTVFIFQTGFFLGSFNKEREIADLKDKIKVYERLIEDMRVTIKNQLQSPLR